MRLVLVVIVSLLSGCSFLRSLDQPTAAPTAEKHVTKTEMTCYDDCRSDGQSSDFCTRRCTD